MSGNGQLAFRPGGTVFTVEVVEKKEPAKVEATDAYLLEGGAPDPAAELEHAAEDAYATGATFEYGGRKYKVLAIKRGTA